MKNKSYAVIIITSILLVVAIGGTLTGYADSKEESTTVETTTNTFYTKFVYDIDRKYTSRQQVYAELERLSEAFESFCDDLDDESVSENFERYKHYKSVLSNELSSLPETKTDIVLEKEKLLYETLDNCRDELHFAKENASLAGKTGSEASYSAQKEKLEKVSTAVSEYEKAEITIDEALSRCGVIYENSSVNTEKNEDVSGASE